MVVREKGESWVLGVRNATRRPMAMLSVGLCCQLLKLLGLVRIAWSA